MRAAGRFVALAVSLVALAGCGDVGLSEAERDVVASLSLAALPPVPDDPSNRVFADPDAALFGEALFNDARLSVDGTVSCATCHLSDRQFQDDLPLAQGVGTTNRRTMPLAGVAWSPWQFWDGRKDTLWSQALAPLEDHVEHGGNRAAYAHLVAREYGDDYERLFGPLPDLSGVPADASPLGDEAARAAWDGMGQDDRFAVDTVFANLGKAIAAFERGIVHEETRFDRFATAVAAGRRPEGDAAFSDLELEGLRLFIGKANCLDCHNGPRFTDDHFHNTGVPAVPGLPEDRGRAAAVEIVLADPFNCQGPYSDAPEDGCAELRFMVRDSHELERAFKTPSLRGAAGRPPFMHSGQIATLEEVIDHYSRAPGAPAGHSELRGVVFTDRGKAALIAFLKTLGE
jgi:cytochrome c peroxidase